LHLLLYRYILYIASRALDSLSSGAMWNYTMAAFSKHDMLCTNYDY
jgi:hypothetical protein